MKAPATIGDRAGVGLLERVDLLAWCQVGKQDHEPISRRLKVSQLHAVMKAMRDIAGKLQGLGAGGCLDDELEETRTYRCRNRMTLIGRGNPKHMASVKLKPD